MNGPEHDEPRIHARLVSGVAMFGLARGLSMDELIAATGAFKLRDGALVNLLEPGEVSPERVVGH